MTVHEVQTSQSHACNRSTKHATTVPFSVGAMALKSEKPLAMTAKVIIDAEILLQCSKSEVEDKEILTLTTKMRLVD